MKSKELIIEWMKVNLDSNKEFVFGTHSVASDMPDYGFRKTGHYFSAGTYDRKFRNLKEEFLYNSQLNVSSQLSRAGLTIEEIKRVSKEKYYLVRSKQNGEIH